MQPGPSDKERDLHAVLPMRQAGAEHRHPLSTLRARVSVQTAGAGAPPARPQTLPGGCRGGGSADRARHGCQWEDPQDPGGAPDVRGGGSAGHDDSRRVTAREPTGASIRAHLDNGADASEHYWRCRGRSAAGRYGPGRFAEPRMVARHPAGQGAGLRPSIDGGHSAAGTKAVARIKIAGVAAAWSMRDRRAGLALRAGPSRSGRCSYRYARVVGSRSDGGN
jgi:hypothetical protein